MTLKVISFKLFKHFETFLLAIFSKFLLTNFFTFDSLCYCHTPSHSPYLCVLFEFNILITNTSQCFANLRIRVISNLSLWHVYIIYRQRYSDIYKQTIVGYNEEQVKWIYGCFFGFCCKLSFGEHGGFAFNLS